MSATKASPKNAPTSHDGEDEIEKWIVPDLTVKDLLSVIPYVLDVSHFAFNGG